jgi:DNA-binding transcriptional ArsR family regulator
MYGRRVDHAVFAALADPNRMRIVELLGRAPRSVGEVAQALRLRQPQATKHLQTLARAGLVDVRPDGRRRIYALRREALRSAAGWLEGLPAAEGTARTRPRTLRFERALPAPREAAWRAWTAADFAGEAFRAVEAREPEELRFELGPPVAAACTVRLADRGASCGMVLTIDVPEADASEAPALARLRPTWERRLERLAAELRAG